MSRQDATRVGRDARHYREHQSRKQAQQKEQRAPPSESFHGREGYRNSKRGTMRSPRRSFHAKSRESLSIISIWQSRNDRLLLKTLFTGDIFCLNSGQFTLWHLKRLRIKQSWKSRTGSSVERIAQLLAGHYLQRGVALSRKCYTDSSCNVGKQ
jgi:hypothetical protein